MVRVCAVRPGPDREGLRQSSVRRVRARTHRPFTSPGRQITPPAPQPAQRRRQARARSPRPPSAPRCEMESPLATMPAPSPNSPPPNTACNVRDIARIPFPRLFDHHSLPHVRTRSAGLSFSENCTCRVPGRRCLSVPVSNAGASPDVQTCGGCPVLRHAPDGHPQAKAAPCGFDQWNGRLP
jgi:hypothetical protein